MQRNSFGSVLWLRRISLTLRMGRTSTMRQLLRTISKEEAETFQTFYENQKENKIYTAMLTWNMFVLLLRIAGPVLFLLLQISTIITAREVANGSRANLSPLPNIFLFANCIVWSINGVLKEDGTIFIPNFIGVLTSLYCMIIFHSYMAIKPYKMYFLALILCVGCLHLARLGEVSTIGLLGSTLAVLFMASPLTVVRTVIRDKSTQSLPFATSLVIWLNSLR